MLSAYYFRAHMYTCVPHQIREDMEWMADAGTDAVVLGILEQDLHAAVENIERVASEARRVGMEMWVTPSRLGNLVAGCPKVPSIFSAMHHEAWAYDREGHPQLSFLGPVASVHHPATFDFFCDTLFDVLKKFPVSGIIWDELKNLSMMDYSQSAQNAIPADQIDRLDAHVDATIAFFDRVGEALLSRYPELRISLFLEGTLDGYPVERCARMQNLHDFGCDGRPFALADQGSSDSGPTPAKKCLCDHGPYFKELAQQTNKRSLYLIENHAMKDEDIAHMDKRLPEILGMEIDHLIYYYFPRSVQSPYRCMNTLRRHLQEYAAR